MNIASRVVPARLSPTALRRSSTQLTTNTQTDAGIISLLNDRLHSSGRALLGFLNAWLYEVGRTGLNDVTSGSNPGCNTDGFSAITGWDPVRPARFVSLHFQRWLILFSIGYGSWDTRLCGTAARS